MAHAFRDLVIESARVQRWLPGYRGVRGLGAKLAFSEREVGPGSAREHCLVAAEKSFSAWATAHAQLSRAAS
jgi:hypothetical protein